MKFIWINEDRCINIENIDYIDILHDENERFVVAINFSGGVRIELLPAEWVVVQRNIIQPIRIEYEQYR